MLDGERSGVERAAGDVPGCWRGDGFRLRRKMLALMRVTSLVEVRRCVEENGLSSDFSLMLSLDEEPDVEERVRAEAFPSGEELVKKKLTLLETIFFALTEMWPLEELRVCLLIGLSSSESEPGAAPSSVVACMLAMKPMPSILAILGL